MKAKAIVLAGVLVLAVGCGGSGSITAGSGGSASTKPSTSSESVNPNETPYVVRQAILRVYPGSTIKSLDLVTDNLTGITHYQAKVTTVLGNDVQVEVTRQGKIVPRK